MTAETRICGLVLTATWNSSFQGSQVTTDAEQLAYYERSGLMEMAQDALHDGDAAAICRLRTARVWLDAGLKALGR